MIDKVKIIECPRDAMQSIKTFIPTNTKLSYLQSVVDVGFDVVDIGSFVSPKAIPQLSDTSIIIDSIDLSNSNSELLVIVANKLGAINASKFDKIGYLGYPFSISENFQMRNTNKTIKDSEKELAEIISIAEKVNKKVVVYLSMCFGNPYGDPWNLDIVNHWVYKLSKMGVKIISLSDTIGTSNPESIKSIFYSVLKNHIDIEFGAHLHSDPSTWYNKIHSAFEAGCRRFDGAIKGFGGCPMASNKLVGNMPTEKILSYLNSKKIHNNVSSLRFESCYNQSLEVFNKFH
ncbi:MAG: hydroxymethylglutaryl-CoA lyase [Flavobacteriales bacterium]|nr:MAG: hydroxymethylglutaryl-CoA lyase [Flavobacteriales bacterium]|tara:strand:- start:2867 stop:3733 length:867 start_codon:yes stop_codon:yes gene_type:complete